MIQGGDPTGTGKGGTSIWGKKFNDEIRESLKVLVCNIRSDRCLPIIQWLPKSSDYSVAS